MKLTYETGIATMIQFIVLTLLNIITGTNSVVTSCRANSGDCAAEIMLSMIFFILICIWFVGIWMLGVAAQTRRSKRLAQLLILAELAIIFVAFINIHGRNSNTPAISLITSAVDLILAIWVITLAFRLMRAKGGRVVGSQRSRARKRPIQTKL